jgi:hypothetical protein
MKWTQGKEKVGCLNIPCVSIYWMLSFSVWDPYFHFWVVLPHPKSLWLPSQKKVSFVFLLGCRRDNILTLGCRRWSLRVHLLLKLSVSLVFDTTFTFCLFWYKLGCSLVFPDAGWEYTLSILLSYLPPPCLFSNFQNCVDVASSSSLFDFVGLCLLVFILFHFVVLLEEVRLMNQFSPPFFDAYPSEPTNVQPHSFDLKTLSIFYLLWSLHHSNSDLQSTPCKYDPYSKILPL